MLIITGPNMGGKSTYASNGAPSLLAHIGCYVPAESATIVALWAYLYSIGASDDLASWAFNLHG
ncbi:hypothetical protein OK016_06195 [Vibrio chagasii]|nr:hypothetical protein [Vibrio chagasii]